MAISLKASVEGLQRVDQARQFRGWLKAEPQWLETAGVASATLKRFWRGYPIQRDSFIAICEAIGENWETIADHGTEGVTREEIRGLHERVRLANSKIDPSVTADLSDRELRLLAQTAIAEMLQAISETMKVFVGGSPPG